MGWRDRDYSRSDYESQGIGGMLWRLLTGSVFLGTWLGVNVRVHASLIILIACNLLIANSAGGMGIKNALASSIILFGIVLLHEFGHCIAARKVGGQADHILLWPLGGLAFVSTPQRPWPSFVGVAGGPLVNVIICVVTGLALLVMSGFQIRLPWNPLLPFGGAMLYNDAGFRLLSSNTAFYLWWIYTTSFMLFFFNMLPIFPLDGGRILQTMLWPRFGFYESMNFSCIVGMIGAVCMGLLGLTGNFLLLFIGISCFFTCHQMRQSLPELSEAAWRDSQYYGGGSQLPRMPRVRRQRRSRPRDDKFTLRDLNPFERIARWRRRRQFERLFEDDKK